MHGLLLRDGGVNMSMLITYIKRAEEAPSLSNEQIRNEANAYNNLRSTLMAWDSLAKDSRNKNDWNNFAKYVLKEVQEIATKIKEVEK